MLNIALNWLIPHLLSPFLLLKNHWRPPFFMVKSDEIMLSLLWNHNFPWFNPHFSQFNPLFYASNLHSSSFNPHFSRHFQNKSKPKPTSRLISWKIPWKWLISGHLQVTSPRAFRVSPIRAASVARASVRRTSSRPSCSRSPRAAAARWRRCCDAGILLGPWGETPGERDR